MPVPQSLLSLLPGPAVSGVGVELVSALQHLAGHTQQLQAASREAKSAAEAAAAAAEAAAAGKAAAAADLQELQEAYGELQQQHGHLTVSGAGVVLEHVCIVVPEKRYSTVQHSAVQCAAMQ